MIEETVIKWYEHQPGYDEVKDHVVLVQKKYLQDEGIQGVMSFKITTKESYVRVFDQIEQIRWAILHKELPAIKELKGKLPRIYTRNTVSTTSDKEWAWEWIYDCRFYNHWGFISEADAIRDWNHFEESRRGCMR